MSSRIHTKVERVTAHLDLVLTLSTELFIWEERQLLLLLALLEVVLVLQVQIPRKVGLQKV